MTPCKTYTGRSKEWLTLGQPLTPYNTYTAHSRQWEHSDTHWYATRRPQVVVDSGVLYASHWHLTICTLIITASGNTHTWHLRHWSW